MTLAERIGAVRSRILRACESVGRDPAGVTLVAVTKTVPIATLLEAYDLGLRCFGENRLQEALPKIAALPPDVEWHFIGRLQSNKAKAAAEAFQVVQTLETQAQLDRIDKASRQIDGLIELNLAQEPQKAGVFVESLDKTITLVQQCRSVRYRGLMTVGPPGFGSEGNRPLFRQMSELGARFGAEWLSMGMSADFEAAIQEGSTHIRVGTAIFGERD